MSIEFILYPVYNNLNKSNITNTKHIDNRLYTLDVVYFYLTIVKQSQRERDRMTDSEKLDLLLEKVGTIEKKVSNIELTLENEIRTNIKRVAEGHLDLSRNLHEALKIDSEKEMLAIRVSVLETELRRIKERLEIA